ncbi:MAG: TldD/PmbA family protein [Thaumarchaeota archaeon]|nr:TldD/PmbA family protein [Nitrososphaerota archaeon]MBI3641089.1 TldD/PmbA family protein [Nitrososphaerota archaeon]
MSACEKVLSKAKSLHLDECEAFFVERKITTVRITDSEIAELKQNQERGLAVRIIHEKRIGSAKTTNFENNIVEKALQSTSLVKPKNFWKSLPSSTKFPIVEKTFDKKLAEISGIEASDIAQEMINAAKQQKITTISGSLNIVSENIEIVNSNGLNCTDKATYIAGNINADSDYGITPVSGVGTVSSRTANNFSAETVGKDAAEMCINSINPESCQSETYSIIFEPYAVGEMLAFVFSSNFNLKTYSEKRSCFVDKIGKNIATENFNLIDDPHYPEGIGSKSFDDEGVSTLPQHLIKLGVFTNTFSDSFYAFKEGKKSTGNASRMGSPMGRNAQPIPFPLPHNLRIDGKGETQDEIIKNTKKGLLVGRLWYTYPVNPERGDFSCTARSGIRIIENGAIKKPGKSVRIVHNLPTLLQNVSAIGKDTKNVLQWSSLPCITPSIKVDGVKVVPI